MSHITPEETILLAKLRHIEELERLSICTGFIETIGLMIHQLQAERGASCLYLASTGQRLVRERDALIVDNMALQQKFSSVLQRHLDESTSADAKQLTLISWILLGLAQLTSFRQEVSLMKISFADCMQSYTRLISGLISLIFEITDSTVSSTVSTDLVALYNLVQGKEFAGQERAVGSYMVGSGSVQHANQQKMLGLIELQDRHFEAFNQFTTDALKQAWMLIEHSACSKRHRAFRQKLVSSHDEQSLIVSEAKDWFDICSQRLTDMWGLQCQLIQHMHETLETLIKGAQADLDHTRTYLKELKSKPQRTSSLDGTFFNLSIPVENAFSFHRNENLQSYPMESIIQLLQEQSQQIAKIESELSDTKKALAERKQIEHAKGLIMNKMGISEVEAYKVLRKTAMEQNRKIIEVAENILSLAKPNQ
jgi:Nitrate and nitrite sensing/ANTAR domain